jgi:hypothetical protein
MAKPATIKEQMNNLTFDDLSGRPSYLNGIELQTKKRFFPSFAMKTPNCKNNNLVVNANISSNGVNPLPLG